MPRQPHLIMAIALATALAGAVAPAARQRPPATPLTPEAQRAAVAEALETRTLLSGTVLIRANMLLTMQGFVTSRTAPGWPWFDDQFRTTLRLVFEKGKLTNVVEERMTGETEWFPAFPPRTLLQVIFGYHSRLEIAAAHSDCWAFGDAAVLLDALFPKRPSHVIPLG